VRQKVELKPSDMKRSIQILALGFPKIAFKFKDDYQLIQTFGSGNCVDTFKTLFGQKLLDSLSVVQDKESNISIDGFVSNQTYHSKHHQYLYVNQRYISKSVIHDQIDARNKKGDSEYSYERIFYCICTLYYCTMGFDLFTQRRLLFFRNEVGQISFRLRPNETDL
jgi:DNA mismatch repair ATPase MutL